MARPQTMASLEAKEELTLKQIQELEEKLRAKKAQLKKVQTQTLTASNKKFKEYGLDLKKCCTSGRYCGNDCNINSRRYYFHRRNRSYGIYCFTKRKRSSCYQYSYFCRRT